MKRFVKFFLGMALLAAGVAVTLLLVAKKPEAKKEPDARPPALVDVVPLKFQSKVFQMPSQGIVDAKRRTVVSAEVAGRVEKVADDLHSDRTLDLGQRFQKDEVILQLEDSDYQAALKAAELTLEQARESLAQAELTLATEEAKRDQAEIDWEKFKRGGEKPSPLTLREPQLKSARAAIDSAEAAIASAESAVEKAMKDLERTKITMPFDGVLSRVDVEVGAYLSPGTPIVEVFSTSPWEVRLPLSLEEFGLLRRDEKGSVVGAEVTFLDGLQDSDSEGWKSRIVRTEGEVDRRTRSIYVVAEVEENGTDSLVKPGVFLEAEVQSKEFSDVAVIPFRSFTDQENEVLVFRKKEPEAGEDAEKGPVMGELLTRKVEHVVTRGQEVWVKNLPEEEGGMQEGDFLLWTQLPKDSRGGQTELGEGDENEWKPTLFQLGEIKTDWRGVDESEVEMDRDLSQTKP